MKPSNTLKFVFALILTVLCINPGFSQNQNIEKNLEEILVRNKAVGLAVVAVKDGKIIYHKSLGYKDLENSIPLADGDLFRIASISKSFTATAIMQLVEKGKIELEGDVSDYIGFKVRNPNFPDTKITIKMLLSHSSSLNDSEGYFNLNVINPDSSKSWTKAYNNYKPGTKYEYCNLGFNTLGTILERVSGERFDKYIVNHILKPLKLYGGYEVGSLDSTKFVRIYSYNQDGSYKWSKEAYAPRTNEIKNYKFGYSTPIFSPTGGMKISALGLAKVMMMHMNYGTLGKKHIIGKPSAELMQSSIIETDPEDNGYYGFAIRTTEDLVDGKKMIGHTGGAYGVFTFMFWDSDRQFGFIVMTNGCNERRDHHFMSIHREVDNCLYNSLIKK